MLQSIIKKTINRSLQTLLRHLIHTLKPSLEINFKYNFLNFIQIKRCLDITSSNQQNVQNAEMPTLRQ